MHIVNKPNPVGASHRASSAGDGPRPRASRARPSRGAPRGTFADHSATVSAATSTLGFLAEPVNYNAFIDGNAAVAFKSLAKKDSTTRARGLEELIALADASPYETTGGIEEATLEAWSRYFPRLSIDESHKVRELSHTCQLTMMNSGRKRMERFIPIVIGPWLAGTYDRDTAVARAAQNGLFSFLKTDEKKLQFYKKLQPKILEHALAGLRETAATLSDLRSIKKDVAESKHTRVQYSCLSLVLLLLSALSRDDTASLADEYRSIFTSESMRAAMVSDEPSLRRISYGLALECLNSHPDLIEDAVPSLHKVLVKEAQTVSQHNSVVALVKLLGNITEVHPSVWSTAKTHAIVKLKPLLEKGSQNTPATPSTDFWAELNKLLSALPVASISAHDASAVLTSFQRGLNARDEPRANAVSGWTVYLATANRLLDCITPEDKRRGLFEAFVLPIFGHFLSPPAPGVWDTSAHLPVVTSAAFLVSRKAYPDIVEAARAEWAKIATAFSARMANSLPEVSSDFQPSQQVLANEGDRLFSLLASIHESVQKMPADKQSTNLVESVLAQPAVDIMQSAVDLLQKRNYKPFGAAELLLSALTRAPHVFATAGGQSVMTSLLPADSSEALSLIIASPSAPTLLSCLHACAGIPEFCEHYQTVYASMVATLLSSASDANAPETAKTMATLLSTASDAAHATNRRNGHLQSYLYRSCLAVAQGTSASWDLFNAVFAANELTLANTQKLAADIVASMTAENQDAQSLVAALAIVARRVPSWMGDDESLQLDLMSKLLVLLELNDSEALSAKITALREILDANSKNSGGSVAANAARASSNHAALITIIQSNIDSTSPDSLEVDTLVEQVKGIVKSGDVSADDLLPDTGAWVADLQTFLQGGLNASLSLTSALRGAHLLVPPARHGGSLDITRDRHGNCKAARMASFTAKLLRLEGFALSSLPQELQVELLFALYLVSEVGADQVALDARDSFWGDLSANPTSTSSGFALAAAEEQIADIQSLLASVVAQLPETAAHALTDLVLQQTRELTPLAVYAARALSLVVQTRSAQSGVPSEAYLAALDVWKVGKPETALGAIAFLTGYGELLASSKTINTFANRLVSEVSGLSLDPLKCDKTLTTLAVLNAALGVYKVGAVPAASNRLMFAVQHLTAWFDKQNNDDDADADADAGAQPLKMNTRIIAESCWALSYLLPCVKDVYGPHWERSIRFCISLWRVASRAAPESDAPLAYLYASLKLVGTVKAASDDDDASDDLADAMRLSGDALWDGARSLLLARAHFPASIAARPQPHQLVDNALARMASQAPLGRQVETEPYFAMVSSDARAIQAAGYTFLHRAIPREQADLSANAILEKKTVDLPSSLLALLAEAPTLEDYPDDVLATFPTRLRSYLLGWKLVFDAFSTASAKIRGQYAEQVAHADLLTGLFDFAVDVLGHTVGQPLNLAREGLGAPSDIVDYDLAAADADADERHLHRLLVHVYYLSLKYVPSLFKNWWMACRSKQTTMALDAWTAKYFSPMLIDDALDEAAAWADAQAEDGNGGDDDEQRAMVVSVRRKARQVVASFEIDEADMAITLQVPANYPIGKVACQSSNRLLVSEDKWAQWIRITEGVIAFSNGSLVDGLVAFRSNVGSRLKGYSECSICYCFISENRKVPEARCATCKNMFHNLCLYKWLSTSGQNTCPLCRNPIGLHYSSKPRRDGRAVERE